MSVHTNPADILSEDQKDMLFFIYEREKVARDVYITLGKIYNNDNMFALMQFEEQRHINCTRDLCNAHGIETSDVDEEKIGVFQSQVLQAIYDACIEKGEKSLHEAFEVAEFIEATDIQDLDHASVGMPSDVVEVYEKLKNRNLRHLGVFQAALSRAA